jgi:hypothetical protein
VRQELSAPLAADLNAYMLAQRARLSRGHDLAKAMTYILKRWDAFTLFLQMVGSVYRTMPQKAPCAASLSVGSHGSSADPTVAANVPRRCTA